LPHADENLAVTSQAVLAGPCLITASGELDYHTGPRLRAALEDVPLESGGVLLLDLSGVTYCDSTGVSVLAQAYRRAEATGATLALAGAAPAVFRLLAFTGLDRLFPSYDSVDAALSALTA